MFRSGPVKNQLRTMKKRDFGAPSDAQAVRNVPKVHLMQYRLMLSLKKGALNNEFLYAAQFYRTPPLKNDLDRDLPTYRNTS